MAAPEYTNDLRKSSQLGFGVYSWLQLVDLESRHDKFSSFKFQVYLFYNQKIIDPCGTYIQSQVNTGINIGIIYN